MRMPARRLIALAVSALVLAACSGDPPSPPPATPAAPAVPAEPPATSLDTDALRQRASDALAANRLYAPAGNNAVEDYLALKERQPDDATVDTALVDLAPYVVIGAEQATAAEDFGEAARLVDLLARMDADAPAVPRLREALEAVRSAAEARLAAEQAESERLAAEAERRATAPPKPANTAAPPGPTSTAARPPAPANARPAEPTRTGTPTPPARPAATAPASPPSTAPAPATAPTRPLLHRVQPRFPEAAVRRRLEGEVELRVSIRADGVVDGVEVLRAEPQGVFDREAVLAVRRWRYAPAEAAGETRVVLQFKRP